MNVFGEIGSPCLPCPYCKIKCFKNLRAYSTALYACDTRTNKKTDREKILAFECTFAEEHYTWIGQCRSQNRELRRRLNTKSDLIQIYSKEYETGFTAMGHDNM